jgi:hypothetical protein
MKRPLVIPALLVAALAASPCYALTLEPIAGSTPQSTDVGAIFPVPLGVIVRADDGSPAAGVPVTFEIPFPLEGQGFGFFWPGDGSSSSNVLTVNSDATGLALPPEVFGANAGDFPMTASAADAAPAQFALTALAAMPWHVEVAGGDHQITTVGSPFAEPWSVRVLDENHQPVPFAGVQFVISRADGPGGTFAPGPDVAIADANGIATAPLLTANDVVGAGQGFAIAFIGHDKPHRAVAGMFEFTIQPAFAAH